MPLTCSIDRRDFLKLSASAAVGLSRPLLGAAPSGAVRIAYDPLDTVAAAPAAQWAAGFLQRALSERGVTTEIISNMDLPPAAVRTVLLVGSGTTPSGFSDAGPRDPHPESVRVIPGSGERSHDLCVISAGVLGLVYGLTDLADRVRCSTIPIEGLELSNATDERPANEVRSAARAFCSEIEDKPWFYDKDFWRGYLDHLVTSRFNRFNLAFGFGYDFPKGVTGDYFHFPYPYLIEVPGYHVTVSGVSEEERSRNMETLRFIAAETAARGLQFQLGIWTHAYQWTDSPQADHHVEGLTPATHAAYCRDALAILLKECPQITGLTLRVHGESGVPEGSYDFWRTLFQAVQHCGRKVEIDMHAKGINQIMIDMAADTGMRVKVGAKSWAEHMGLGYQQADIRELEIPRADRMETGIFSVSNGARRFTRYGYADLFQEARKYNVLFRLWPGTQHHLLWGDPEMAAAYGRTAHFCGAAGLELCEPLTFKGREGSGHPGGRCAYLDKSLEPQADWEKFAYTYRLWGRMLYNPDTPPDVWRRHLARQFGKGASSAEVALANASRVLPLVTTAHLPSASNHSFWPEIYTNMSIPPGQRSPYGDTPTPRRFGTVSPLDPQLFSSIVEYVTDTLAGNASPKYSPLTVATWLEGFSSTAAQSLEQFRGSARSASPDQRRWVEDLAIQIALGRFFAAKLRSGVAYELFLQTGSADAGKQALAKYREARDAWAPMSQRAAQVYVADISYGEIPQRRGNWADRLPAIDADIAAMQASLATPPAGNGDPARIGSLRDAVQATPAQWEGAGSHEVPAAFSPGKPFDLSFRAENAENVMLFYRHVNQGERWKSAPMQKKGEAFTVAIPGDYTQSLYPLQYYFVLQRGHERGFYPKFNATLSNEPYFVVWHRV